MRILITGAGGRLGGRLAQTLNRHGHDIIAVAHGELDVTDFAATHALIVDAKPDVIIHPAAWTDVDACAKDPERAILINGFGAQHVAIAAAEVGAAIVYLSSNEVFDGSSEQPYREYDTPRPANPYGYSKWVGEQTVLHANRRHYIVRTSWVFAHGGKNFIQTILNAAQAGKTLRVVTDEIANPTYNDDLADAITALITTGRYGIYHLVNEGACSRWEFARYVLDQTGNAHIPIEKITRADWPRPSTPPGTTPLLNLAGRCVGVSLRSWQEAVNAFLEREGLLTSNEA